VAQSRRDPYAILGVSRGASRDEIGRAYRARAKRAHPDLGSATPTAMQDLNWAWRLLADPRRRAEWDRMHGGTTSSGHWATDAMPRRPDIHARDQDWSAQPGWTFSGESWGGPGAPAVEQRAAIGCVGLTMLAVGLFAFVLFAAFISGYQPPGDQPVQQSEAATQAPAEP
jgi:curved DNA-binding protein CbpA